MPFPRRFATLVGALAVASACSRGGASAAQTGSTRPETSAVSSSSSASASVSRPRIVWKPIPFGPKRRRQMAAYVKRHYGFRSWRLSDPHVIVEHYTGGNSVSSAWYTFASNSPDLGELPGTCAHFIIGRSGRIYQLVRLGTICRHTVGLNFTSFGIEHVGTSDRQILTNSKQMRASLHLTVWLMQRFHIQLRNVIGHAESLTSPYHMELVKSWQCQTHSDWQHKDMQVYRRRLRKLAAAHGVLIGPKPNWVHPNC